MLSLRRTVSIAVLLAAGGLSAPVHAEPLRGVALVVGQADYDTLGDLGNPLNDARAMDDMLSELGFDVTRVLDRGGERLKREIEDFLDDAAGADVAVVYYAGHAVEAGGQNYLVPIDADLSSPASAGASLVPVADLLDELAREVPVTILLLDACRTEAFPDGTSILLPGAETPVEVAPTGLGEMRGPTPVLANIDPESLGMVIGFASAPGQAALDGPPGTHSPYAAALLKHLGAGGYAFGDLMTMVAEEVYLKTGARQVPWVNSSLRRVLSFETVEEDDRDEALIRDGRRRLLLSIAATPAAVQKQVEAAAAEAAVPMDTLYGLLDAMGQDAPSDPAALNQLLQTQTATLRQVMEERQALTSTDAEIVRLSGLAQRAMDEGALAVSVGFWEQAKARYQQVSASLDATEAQLEQRRREGGTLLASVADSYMLSHDYEAAAENFGLAAGEVDRWDEALAVDYRGKQAEALFRHGEEKGENAAFTAAIDIYNAVLPTVDGTTVEWGMLQVGLGSAYSQLAQRIGDRALMDKGVAAFRAAVAVLDRGKNPEQWGRAQTSLGAALAIVADTNTDPAVIEESIAAYRAALGVLSPTANAKEWGRAQLNLGSSLMLLGQRESGTGTMLAAIAAFEASLGVTPRDKDPLLWALLQNNLGGAQMLLGMRTEDDVPIREAIGHFRAALEVTPRADAPLQWAQAQGSIGTALWQLGTAENDPAKLEESAIATKASLEELTPERAIIDWAYGMINLATAQTSLGLARDRDADIVESIATSRAVLARFDRAQGAMQWGLAQNNLGASLIVLGRRHDDAQPFAEAATALRAALDVRTREVSPLDWAMSQKNLGDALVGMGLHEPGIARLDEAVAAYRAALEVRDTAGPRTEWADTQVALADTLYEIGIREERGVERYAQALDAYSAATTVITRESAPLDWATIYDKAGWTLANAAFRMQDRDTFLQARNAIQEAWDTVKASGQTQHDVYFAERLKLIDEAIAGFAESESSPAD